MAASPTPTFYKDVLPVLQDRCQSCHRQGEAGPMALLDYKATRPYAKAIKAAVLGRKMPPWPADPHYGVFENDRRLSDAEVSTITAWADGGAPEGNPKDAPKPVAWVEGWTIGNPDVVLPMPQAVDIPATGTIEYQYLVIPTGFTKDTWVTAAEVRPGNRAVVHHVIAFLRPPGSPWMADAKPGVPFVPGKEQRGARRQAANGEDLPSELLVGYAPGMPADKSPAGAAKLVKAGSDIVLQLHYTSNGTATKDQTRIGLVLAKETPQFRQVTMNATQNKFAIPPGDPNYEVKSEITLRDDAELVNLMPHMHLRGKDFAYKAVYPTGESSILLSVPKYDFNWQLVYMFAKPVLLPKGTKIECTAHFDNSANNPANPDPTKVVKWGDQSWDEMMIGWFDVIIPATKSPMNLYKVGE
ncbi:MAG TPA: hypothetical protein VMT15_17660 [Bryobacteraceae bacterium]|nr:hypothetical protein [Bryobacteraceae bacterium]